MPAYLYPITINRVKETVSATFIEYLDSNTITAKLLGKIAGSTPFSISEESTGGYRVEVYATRLETNTEYKTRITKAEAYMAEYNKRKNIK